MQELIDDILNGKILEVLSNQEKYKEKEKQTIIEAYKKGVDNNNNLSFESAEKYYNEKFKNK